MTLNVSVVVGNPKPQSRTLTVATSLVEHLLDPGTYEMAVIDLVDHQDEMFSWPSDEMLQLNASVAASDLVVFASPTYKATYTGLLKAFLDRYPAGGLAGVVAIPILTGADWSHSMGPTHNVAPLLAELGAIIPGGGFYFVSSHMDRLDAIAEEAAAVYRTNITRVAGLASSLLVREEANA